MRFKIVDNSQLGRTVATGECAEDYSGVEFSSKTVLIDNYERRYGPINTLSGVSAKMPRLNIVTPEAERRVATGDIMKLAPEKQQVFGWAYRTHKADGSLNEDRSGEFIDDPDVLEDAAYRYVLASRKGGTDHTRAQDSVVQKSTMIESMVFTEDKIEKLGLPSGIISPGSWWVGFAIEDSEVWKGFKEGRWTQFSIHGRGTKEDV